jgi:hypothetical protein
LKLQAFCLLAPLVLAELFQDVFRASGHTLDLAEIRKHQVGIVLDVVSLSAAEDDAQYI